MTSRQLQYHKEHHPFSGNRNFRDERRQFDQQHRVDERESRRNRFREGHEEDNPGNGRSRSVDFSEDVSPLEEDMHRLRNLVKDVDHDNRVLAKAMADLQKTVARNEMHSRSRNLRIYGFLKSKVQQDVSLYTVFEDLLRDGMKMPEEKQKLVMGAIDVIHWTNEKNAALMVAFSQRKHKGLMEEYRSNLGNAYQPHGKPISIQQDLEKSAQVERKERNALLKEMKKSKPAGTEIKPFSFNQIAVNGVKKYYKEWV